MNEHEVCDTTYAEGELAYVNGKLLFVFCFQKESKQALAFIETSNFEWLLFIILFQGMQNRIWRR